jgi:hypothetical protein
MKKQLSTDEGQTKKGDVYLLLAFIQPVIYAMSPGWPQVIAASVALLILAVLSYRTVGSGVRPEEAKAFREKLDTLSEEELVREGRE